MKKRLFAFLAVVAVVFAMSMNVHSLIPDDADFDGVPAHIETVVDSGLEVFAQNVETVKRLTHPVRDPPGPSGLSSSVVLRKWGDPA